MGISAKLAEELPADYKEPEDIVGEKGLPRQLTKALLERALEAELTSHLGCEKHDPARDAMPCSLTEAS
jgi:putative transposase